ncbi:hypothetical protein HMPREF1546_04004, partial [Oscillibacter sp. KLE 1745]
MPRRRGVCPTANTKRNIIRQKSTSFSKIRQENSASNAGCAVCSVLSYGLFSDSLEAA